MRAAGTLGDALAPPQALCWSPCGQFLAAGSPQDSAFAVWDIATRVWCGVLAAARCISCQCLTVPSVWRCSTRLRSGMAGARLLRWSPLGNYLLVAGFDKRGFEIWETHSW